MSRLPGEVNPLVLTLAVAADGSAWLSSDDAADDPLCPCSRRETKVSDKRSDSSRSTQTDLVCSPPRSSHDLTAGPRDNKDRVAADPAGCSRAPRRPTAWNSIKNPALISQHQLIRGGAGGVRVRPRVRGLSQDLEGCGVLSNSDTPRRRHARVKVTGRVGAPLHRVLSRRI